jgi:antitoxin HicB
MNRNGEKGPLAFRVPIVLVPQPEGGFTVTSPAIPELVTEGDSVNEAIDNAREALQAVFEIYEKDGRALPESIDSLPYDLPIQADVFAIE